VRDTLAALDLLQWKPVLTALALPPMPWLLLLLLAWWWRRRRPLLGHLSLALALLGLWLSQCQGTARLLENQLSAAPALSPNRVLDLRRSLAAGKTAVVVLGNGTRPLAPEYGEAHLSAASMERLHYGLWLARQVQAPLLFSGGVGYAQADGPAEAQVAARVAARDWGRPLRWVEADSRDTRENARLSVAMLKADGVSQALLVTHGWHMRRAQRAFEQEAALQGAGLQIQPAPMGMQARSEPGTPLHWLPSPEGYRRVHQALREIAGLLVGA
jgi:uncharacterized SAM-binding protein YcdF (DUF218 family)